MANYGTGKNIPSGDTPHYFDRTDNPEKFVFEYERVDFINKKETEFGILYDFGMELYAQVVIDGAKSNDTLTVCYGESVEEALDVKNAILFEKISGSGNYKLRARAFRYLHITGLTSNALTLYANYEYLPLKGYWLL